MNIILVLDNLKCVFTEKCPPQLVANTNKNQKDVYDNWVQGNDKGRENSEEKEN